MYSSIRHSNVCKILICNFRAEQAAADPEGLSQEEIISNIDAEEWKRISKVRNIGIAVCDVRV